MVCLYMHGDRHRKHIKKVGEACQCPVCCRALMHVLQWPQKVVLPSAPKAWLFPHS